jgi:hypothetical protein
MSQSRRARHTVASALIGVALAAAGCGGNSGPGGPATDATSSGHPSPSAAPTGPNPLDTAAAATKLCDALRPELGPWETQTPTPNRIAFNVTLVQWAFDAGGISGNVRLLGDKAVVDRLTSRACPDVRGRALAALDAPTLAAAVAL